MLDSSLTTSGEGRQEKAREHRPESAIYAPKLPDPALQFDGKDLKITDPNLIS